MKLVAYGISLFLIVIGSILAMSYKTASPSVILVVYGIFFLVVLAIECGRYVPKLHGSSAQFKPTGERFIDPTTGILMEVRFDPASGERQYVEVPPGNNLS